MYLIINLILITLMADKIICNMLLLSAQKYTTEYVCFGILPKVIKFAFLLFHQNISGSISIVYLFLLLFQKSI